MTKLHELVYNNDEAGLLGLISSLKSVNRLADYINLDGYSNTITGDKFLFQSPLMIAAAMGHLKILKLLIKEGAKVDVACSSSPLLCAVNNGHLDCVRELLQDCSYHAASCISVLERVLFMSRAKGEIQEILQQRITELNERFAMQCREREERKREEEARYREQEKHMKPEEIQVARIRRIFM